jgi:gamma-glutamylcyclotransferase (GGCT)/AIG2-like uncharacterized protein YtfP
LPVLFVYGTLKRGCWNHDLVSGSEYLGGGVVRGYTLLVDGIPYAVPSPKNCLVRGELYRVDWATVRRVDRLEGHPEWYKRTLVRVETKEGTVEAYMYVYPHTRMNRCAAEAYTCTPRYNNQ